jgi:hypothetical protein
VDRHKSKQTNQQIAFCGFLKKKLLSNSSKDFSGFDDI